MPLDSSLNFLEFSGFPRSSRIDFVREPFLFSTTWISGSVSTSDSAFRSSFLALGSSGLSVGLPCSSLHSLHKFPGAGRRTLRGVLQLLLLLLLCLPSTLKYNLRCGINVVPLFEKSLCRCNLLAQFFCTITALDLVCQNRKHVCCARAKLTQ